MKLLSLFQPLIDHLYIFQLQEYQSADLLKWFVKYPFKRHLQRKQRIEFTSHIKALLLISLFLIGFSSYLLCAGISSFILLFCVFLQISPAFIVVAEFLFKPLEKFQKQRIVNAAIAKRKRLNNLVVIAIVGSYAKTSTKNMLYTLLWKDLRVVKTPKSYNTEISIARSILSDLKDSTEVFICEMDAYHEGEIAKLCQIAQPNLGIITAIGPQHLERFGSMEKLARTQFELAECLFPPLPSPLPHRGEGTRQHNNFVSKDELMTPSPLVGEGRGEGETRQLFLNKQDEWSKKLGAVIEGVSWFNNEKNIVSDRKEFEGYQTFTMHLGKEKTEIHLSLKGEHNAVNFLAAATIAHHLGVSIKTITQRAKLIQATDHRLEVSRMGNLTVLDNTYNANPKAALASLQLLASFKNSQKILVTPGFVELGSEHTAAHIEFAKEAAKVADEVIIVGQNAKEPLQKGLGDAKFPNANIHFVESTSKALEHLGKLTQGNQAVVLLENDLPDQYF